eukprot:1144997-Pelagomonas_calceolata.AAC.2
MTIRGEFRFGADLHRWERLKEKKLIVDEKERKGYAGQRPRALREVPLTGKLEPLPTQMRLSRDLAGS